MKAILNKEELQTDISSVFASPSPFKYYCEHFDDNKNAEMVVIKSAQLNVLLCSIIPNNFAQLKNFDRIM